MKSNKKTKSKINRRISLRVLMIEQGAYDGRFRHKVQTINKHKEAKHKQKLYEE